MVNAICTLKSLTTRKFILPSTSMSGVFYFFVRAALIILTFCCGIPKRRFSKSYIDRKGIYAYKDFIQLMVYNDLSQDFPNADPLLELCYAAGTACFL